MSCAQFEIENIKSGRESGWTLGQLEKTVLPEINEFLSHALEGRVFRKYGKRQKLLESTYILTDSLMHLDHTALGKQISELQKLYNRL